MALTTVHSGMLDSNAKYTGFKNRLINSAMVITQRGTSSVTQTTSDTYTVDRWVCGGSPTSKFTVQQNAGSVTPPSGFINYLGVTSSSAYTVSGGDRFWIGQLIEGLNCTDLGWGASGASTVTLSFWVRSSLTGTFGGSLSNNGFSYSYPFTYTISSANTWTQISVTIAGPTAGTWVTDNSIGIRVYFGLGVGSTYSGTAGAWTGSGLWSATGATSVVGTNGATFYITGVQLEKGSTATSFDYRPYGTELALCQRYCFVAVFNSNSYAGVCNGTTSGLASVPYPTPMRVAPTGTFPSGSYGADNGLVALSFTPANMSINYSGVNSARIYFVGGTGGNYTAGQGFNAGTGTVVLSSEL